MAQAVRMTPSATTALSARLANGVQRCAVQVLVPVSRFICPAGVERAKTALDSNPPFFLQCDVFVFFFVLVCERAKRLGRDFPKIGVLLHRRRLSRAAGCVLRRVRQGDHAGSHTRRVPGAVRSSPEVHFHGGGYAEITIFYLST